MLLLAGAACELTVGLQWKDAPHALPAAWAPAMAAPPTAPPIMPSMVSVSVRLTSMDPSPCVTCPYTEWANDVTPPDASPARAPCTIPVRAVFVRMDAPTETPTRVPVAAKAESPPVAAPSAAETTAFPAASQNSSPLITDSVMLTAAPTTAPTIHHACPLGSVKP